MMRRHLLVLPALLVVACGKQDTPPPPSPAATPEPSAPAPAASVRPLPDPLPDPVARVDGQPIPLRHAALIAQRLMGPPPVTAERKASAYRAAMEQLVARELLFQEASDRKILPDANAVDQAYDTTRAQHKTEADWLKFLRQQGLDIQSFKTELRVRHTVEALLKKEAEAVPATASDDEVRAFYDQNPREFESGERLRASHILIRVPGEADPARRAALKTKAEAILARAKKGEDFATLARENSEDQTNAAQGGTLEPFPRGVMVPPFEEAAFALQPGGISPLVETTFGYHIIKLQERMPSAKQPFDAAKDSIKEHLVMLRRQTALTALLDRLKAKAKIETFL